MSLFSSLWPRCDRHRGLLPAAGLALLFATGCQMPWKKPDMQANFEKMTSSQAPLANFDMKKLDKKQQADLKYAGGRAAEASGDMGAAMAAYMEAIKLDPKRADFHLRMGVLNDKLARFEESPAHYRKALELAPGSAEVYCDMGYSLYLQQRYSEAEISLRQATKIQPDHTRAHNNLGMVLSHTGKLEEALQEFHRGGAEPGDAHANVAFALATEGRLDESRKHYKLALAHNPGMEKAQEGISEIERMQEKADRLQAVAKEYGDESANPFVALKHAEARMAKHQAAESGVPAAPKTAQAPSALKTAQAAPVAKPIAKPVAQPTAKPVATAVAKQSVEPAKAWSLDDPNSEVAKVAEAEKPSAVQKAALVEKQTAPVTPAAKQVSATRAAPKLSFSPGALHRDRYLEEQSDPAMQQAGFSTVESP